MNEIGRRYTKRKALPGGLEPLDVEIHHIFSGATERYKKWAIDYLEGKKIAASSILNLAIADGQLNEGAALREHVACIPKTDSDDGIYLAARLYELCRLVEEFQSRPELFRPNDGFQHLFELGRVSMLARVYGIDDVVVNKRLDLAKLANVRFDENDHARWRKLYKDDFSKHSKRRAAELIAASEGLAPSATETIRKVL
jgi:hypothetical protein